MNKNIFLVILVIFCLITISSCKTFNRKLKRDNFAEYWKQSNEILAKDVKVDVQLALTQKNLDLLKETLDAVSFPNSPEYGNHLSLEQIRDLVGLNEKELDIIFEWLKSENILTEQIQVASTNDYIKIKDISIAKIEQLFQTQLSYFDHSVTGHRVVRATSSYSLPDFITEFIEFIPGFHTFPPVSSGDRFNSNSIKEGERIEEVTPSFLRQKYNVPEERSAVSGVSQASVQFAPNFYSASDLQTFFKDFDSGLVGQTIQHEYGSPIKGSYTSVESNLDCEYIMAMGSMVETDIYYVDTGSNIEDAFVSYASYINSQSSPSLVQSISYGQYGGMYDNSTVQRLDNEFQKAGVRGISILLASGDNGVGCSYECQKFLFDFPSSPHITMVGATYFNNGEKGATLSSGGFSEDYFRPSWQSSAVNSYFEQASNLPPANMYDRSGRGYPDIAAAGQNVLIVSNGFKQPVAGTSCSAPISGGIFSLLNNARVKAGKSTLGWLNPLIYENPQAFTDITEGNNKDCRLSCCCQGFDASKGWDPVTGMGSPNYDELLKVVQNLQ